MKSFERLNNSPDLSDSKPSVGLTHDHASPLPKPKTAIYLLPNLITCASLFLGLLAIKYSIDGRINSDINFFVYAAYAILGATVCDAMDGSVARLTRTQSSFGMHLDSLCDMVSFGAAPAILVYSFILHDFYRLGFCMCFIYAACGALRLSRFNVQQAFGKKSQNFTGLPIPMGATALAVYVLLQNQLLSWSKESDRSLWTVDVAQFLTQQKVAGGILLVVCFLLALAMISTFHYIGIKSFRLPNKRPFRVFAGVMIAGISFLNLQFVLFITFCMLVYCFHGPVLWLLTRKDHSAEEDELFEGDADV